MPFPHYKTNGGAHRDIPPPSIYPLFPCPFGLAFEPAPPRDRRRPPLEKNPDSTDPDCLAFPLPSACVRTEKGKEEEEEQQRRSKGKETFSQLRGTHRGELVTRAKRGRGNQETEEIHS